LVGASRKAGEDRGEDAVGGGRGKRRGRGEVARGPGGQGGGLPEGGRGRRQGEENASGSSNDGGRGGRKDDEVRTRWMG